MIGVVTWGWVLTIQLLRLRNWRAESSDLRLAFVVRVTLGQVATLPFVVAGIAMMAGGMEGLYWLVVGMVFSILVALFGAWVLLKVTYPPEYWADSPMPPGRLATPGSSPPAAPRPGSARHPRACHARRWRRNARLPPHRRGVPKCRSRSRGEGGDIRSCFCPRPPRHVRGLSRRPRGTLRNTRGSPPGPGSNVSTRRAPRGRTPPGSCPSPRASCVCRRWDCSRSGLRAGRRAG